MFRNYDGGLRSSVNKYPTEFFDKGQKSFHCSFEVIDYCRKKYVYGISGHTFVKVATQPITYTSLE